MPLPRRKKSPRAPSIALLDAVERAISIYDRERRHPAPVDAVAQALGYKSANNGKALAILASLRYFGLVERPQEGMLAVAKSVEDYKFTPSPSAKRELLLKWLLTPPLYAELLEKYATDTSGLPSEATIRYDLIQRGFSQPAAESALQYFTSSVNQAEYFGRSTGSGQIESDVDPDGLDRAEFQSRSQAQPLIERPSPTIPASLNCATSTQLDKSTDRIPVRLVGGRRAWLEIPTPFFESDRERIKAQIDLLLTDDEDKPESPSYQQK